MYIQFFRGEPLTEMMGGRGVIKVDGRLSAFNAARVAIAEGQKRGAEGYQVLGGDSLLFAKPVSPVYRI